MSTIAKGQAPAHNHAQTWTRGVLIMPKMQPDVGPSIFWYRRFCFLTSVCAMRQQVFMAPYLENFLTIQRLAGQHHARAWLFGTLMNDLCQKADDIREASRKSPAPEDVPT